MLAGGVDLVLVIDVQGARQVRARMPESVGVFVLPPSFEVLAARLRGRNQDPDDGDPAPAGYGAAGSRGRGRVRLRHRQ